MAISPAFRGISLILPRVDARGRLVVAYRQVRLTPRDFAPQGRDFAKLNLHLPACRSLGAGRALFEQPGKDAFFSSPLKNKKLPFEGEL